MSYRFSLVWHRIASGSSHVARSLLCGSALLGTVGTIGIASATVAVAQNASPTSAAPPLVTPVRYPCRTMPEAKQFDFWIGQWVVTPWALKSPLPTQQIGVNDVHPILEHCVVFENWSATSGGEGKSFNYYDTNLHKWRQVWIADSGGPLDYTGEYRDGAMRFTGWTLDPKGARVEQKLTFFNIAPDTVRQLFEASSDGGVTWVSTFDGRYVRSASKRQPQ